MAVRQGREVLGRIWPLHLRQAHYLLSEFRAQGLCIPVAQAKPADSRVAEFMCSGHCCAVGRAMGRLQS